MGERATHLIERRFVGWIASRAEVDLHWLARLTDADDRQLEADLERWRAKFISLGVMTSAASTAERRAMLALYTLLRATQPARTLVIASGTHRGSAIAAAALADNQRGQLTCADLTHIERRLRLVTGGSVEISLPAPSHPVLRELGFEAATSANDLATVLACLAAQDHECVVIDQGPPLSAVGLTYELIWSLLPPGGLLINAHLDRAWLRFGRAVGAGVAVRINASGVSWLRRPAEPAVASRPDEPSVATTP